MLHLFTSLLFNARNMPNEFGGTTQGPKSNERPSARWDRFSSIALCQNIVTDFDTFDSVTRSIAQRNDDSIDLKTLSLAFVLLLSGSDPATSSRSLRIGETERHKDRPDRSRAA